MLIRGENAPNTKVARLVAEGHTIVHSAPPSPEHVWDGTKWVVDASLAAAKVTRDTLSKIIATDADVPRIVEDLIQLLVDKGVISLTDFPTKAREKVEKRRALRGS